MSDGDEFWLVMVVIFALAVGYMAYLEYRGVLDRDDDDDDRPFMGFP